MQFTITFKLDNAEAEEAGHDVAVPTYLRAVAAKVELGHQDGIVWDGNGNRIGTFATTEDDGGE